jgi:gamma-glutamyltranspeptidase/glutathione hydrolase
MAATVGAMVASRSNAGDRLTGLGFATRSEVIAQRGMAATSHPLATQAALDILRAGGSALDAAVTANSVLGLVEPTGSGIGGDLFAIVWDPKTGKLHGLNGSGRSPRNLTAAHLANLDIDYIPTRGHLPVSVPGCVDGWLTLHERFGRLTMAEVLAPAIHYAREGFPLTEVIAQEWRSSANALKEFPGFAETFMPNGRAPRKGEVFKNPNLANTLEGIAQGGREAFYEGEVARTIAQYMKKQGGFLDEGDLADHHSEWVEPVSTNYRGYDVWELPPNGQGIAALQMLNILEGFDIASMGFASPAYLHLLIEAKKLAFEDRAKFYADPDFNEIPTDQLISKAYADERRALIDPDRAALTYDAGDPILEKGDTVYLSASDSDGMMVSLIQSNYSGMGSGMTPDGLGFVLQNRGKLFNLNPSHFNSYAPHKRPFHTIIPAFITKDGKPHMAFGVMGGAMQPQGHTQIVTNRVDFDMNLQEAGDAARMRHEGSSQPTGEAMSDGGRVCLEEGIAQETVRSLIAKGHKIHKGRGGYGGYQAILRDHENEVYYGASESRKDGHAAGY